MWQLTGFSLLRTGPVVGILWRICFRSRIRRISSPTLQQSVS